MESTLRKLALHLLAESSVPLAVAAALAGLWTLSDWLVRPEFARGLIHAAVPVLAGVTLVMYALHVVATLRTYPRGRSSASLHAAPKPKKWLKRLKLVTGNLWKGVGSAFAAFLLLLGIGLLLGVLERMEPDRLTYHVFFWLGRGTLFLSAAALVFSVALMTTHALRSIVRNFRYALNDVRRTEWRRNLPLEVALTALPLFVGLWVMVVRVGPR